MTPEQSAAAERIKADIERGVANIAFSAIKDLRTLLAALDEAQADAARYQWLRELPNADSLNVRFMGTDLDKVIDAARAGDQP